MNPRLDAFAEDADQSVASSPERRNWLGTAVAQEAADTSSRDSSSTLDLSGVESHLSNGRLTDASRILTRMIFQARRRPRTEETHLDVLLSTKAVLQGLVAATEAKESGDSRRARSHASRAMQTLSRASTVDGNLRELLSSLGGTFGVGPAQSGGRDVEPPGVSGNAQSTAGYDPALGQALAQMSMRLNGGNTRSRKECYRYVADAVDAVIGRFLSGRHAYMAASQLAARSNLFTEVPVTSLTSLPAGAIVVWGRGTSKSGHISIALGDGRESSDFIGGQMTSHYGGAAARVFLPKAKM